MFFHLLFNPDGNMLYTLLSALCFLYFTVYLGDLYIPVYKEEFTLSFLMTA